MCSKNCCTLCTHKIERDNNDLIVVANDLEKEGGHTVGDLPEHHHCCMTTSLIPLRSRKPLKSLLHLMIDEIKLQVGRVHSRDLRQPSDSLGG